MRRNWVCSPSPASTNGKPPKENSLMVYYLNVPGLRTKLGIILENVTSCHYDILVFSETWLNQDYTDAELNMFTYNIYRKDRSCDTSVYSRGGGVLVAVNKDINSRVIPSSQNHEFVFVLIGEAGCQYLMVAAYFHPKSPTSAYVSLSEEIDRISDDYPHAQLCVLGDFNLPSGVWINDSFSSTVAPWHGAVGMELDSLEVLSSMCAYHNLYQLNHVHNHLNSALDLIFMSGQASTVNRADFDIVSADRYHPPLVFEMDFKGCGGSGLVPEGFYRDFKSADLSSIVDFLGGFDWDQLLLNQPLDLMLEIFYTILYLAVDLYVPLKKYSVSSCPQWFSPQVREYNT